MLFGINVWMVLAAAVVNMIIGWLWYGSFFRKRWMSLAGMTPSRLAALKGRSMGFVYTMAAIGSLLMSFVLANFIMLASAIWLLGGVMLGIAVGAFVWLGFFFPATLGVVLWEGRSWKLWWINSMYYLITLCAMGAIIGCAR